MIIVQNPGIPDIRAFTTIGISAKEGENTIGYFGSGFKNAVAIILRHGLKITLYSNLDAYHFSTKSIIVRGESFDLVMMNDRELGFTTKMARDWELWMAYRELWSNAKDEDGKVFFTSKTEIAWALPNQTSVVVEGAEFDQVHTNRESFLLESIPFFSTDRVDVHHARTKAIFYQGVKIGEADPYHTDGMSLYTYNIREKITLTEDRTLRYGWVVGERIAYAIMSSEDENFIKKTITADDRFHESRVNLCDFACPKPNKAFLSVMERLIKSCHAPVNKSAKTLYRAHAEKIAEAAQANLSIIEAKQLAKAIAFAESIGFPIQEYPVRVFETLGQNILGRAENGQIKISRYAFSFGGTKMVAATLIEEFIHLHDGVHDCTREFQDLLLNKIVSMGEEINGEPL